MRTREDILVEFTDKNTSNPVKEMLILSALLDIRDLLQDKEEVKRECEHVFDDIVLLSNPPQQKCIKCGHIYFVGQSETPPIPEKLEERMEDLVTALDYGRGPHKIPASGYQMHNKINEILDYLSNSKK